MFKNFWCLTIRIVFQYAEHGASLGYRYSGLTSGQTGSSGDAEGERLLTSKRILGVDR